MIGFESLKAAYAVTEAAKEQIGRRDAPVLGLLLLDVIAKHPDKKIAWHHEEHYFLRHTSPSTLAQAFRYLRADGFIEECEPKGRPRGTSKYYRITKSGRDYLATKVKSLDALPMRECAAVHGVTKLREVANA